MTMAPLRYSEDLEKLELKLLLEAVYQKYGYDFRDFTYSVIRAKIWERIHAEKVGTISAFQDRLLHDEGVMSRLLFAVAARRTGMFEEPEHYCALREFVIPELVDSYFVRVWRPQCSTGEEAFSLAILLQEEGIYEKARIYITNMDEAVLRRAKQGIFDAPGIRSCERDYELACGKRRLSDYYAEQFGNAIFNGSLRRNLVFAQHNLVTDSSPNEFQLIICRNVLVNFNSDLRDRVHKLLYDSLSHDGFLELGSKDTIEYTPFGKRYEEVDASQKIYRKIK
jgi:chemotaxis protein methyltransferase CheR